VRANEVSGFSQGFKGGCQKAGGKVAGLGLSIAGEDWGYCFIALFHSGEEWIRQNKLKLGKFLIIINRNLGKLGPQIS